jgi:hypothetical protein
VQIFFAITPLRLCAGVYPDVFFGTVNCIS